jgi:hypothetical protein
MRTLGFEIDRREIREGLCGKVSGTSNPFLSAEKANFTNKVGFFIQSNSRKRPLIYFEFD